MPQCQVSRQIEIHAPVSEVYAYVRNFRNWPEWSPWLIVEPECRLDFSEDGKHYDWEGEVIGSGRIGVVSEQPDQRIDYDLQFRKPFKSQADVAMEFRSDGSATTVRWAMDSKLPFFLFWMKDTMTAAIGMDYDRGLGMLKDRMERGEIPSLLEHGRAQLEAHSYVGVRSRCEMSELGPSMEADIPKIDEWLEGSGLEATGKLRSFYHKWDLAGQMVEYSIGYPVDRAPDDLPAGMVHVDVPALEAHTVTHTGPYRHLGNAWSAGMMHGRAGTFKQHKKLHPFEIYETRPGDDDEESAVTVVHLPLR